MNFLVEEIPAQEFPAQESVAKARLKRIRSELRNAANSFVNAGMDLRAAKEREEWLDLGLANFGAYCAALDISESWASDVIRIAHYADTFPDYRERMLDIGVSKMRMLLPHLSQETNEAQFDTLLDMANEQTWNELRRELKSATSAAPLPPAVEFCPACGAKLHLSRAAHLEIAVI